MLSDRLPRNLVLVGAALVQGVAQSAIAVLVLTGEATVGLLVALAALYGVGHGLIVPAEVGLVPQTVAPERLQQANALQGLSRNIVFALGPAVGGVLVVAGSPGIALAADAASFFVCAALLQRIRIPRRPDSDRPGFWHELREGWREFSSRTWLWGTVALFGVGNLVWVGCFIVLGPAIAKAELGGAGAWAVILSAGGVGAIVGRSRRACGCALRGRSSSRASRRRRWCFALAGLAVPAPTWILAGVNFLVGAGIAIHLTLWFTVFQQQVPEHAQSRVSSYDALGSFVLMPLGTVDRGAGGRGDRNGRHALGGRRDQRRLPRCDRADPVGVGDQARCAGRAGNGVKRPGRGSDPVDARLPERAAALRHLAPSHLPARHGIEGFAGETGRTAEGAPPADRPVRPFITQRQVDATPALRPDDRERVLAVQPNATWRTSSRAASRASRTTPVRGSESDDWSPFMRALTSAVRLNP